MVTIRDALPRHRISVSMVSTRAMLDGEIIDAELLQPSGKLPLGVSNTIQPFQGSVVNANSKASPIEAVMILLQEVHYGQEFLSRHEVVPLLLG